MGVNKSVLLVFNLNHVHQWCKFHRAGNLHIFRVTSFRIGFALFQNTFVNVAKLTVVLLFLFIWTCCISNLYVLCLLSLRSKPLFRCLRSSIQSSIHRVFLLDFKKKLCSPMAIRVMTIDFYAVYRLSLLCNGLVLAHIFYVRLKLSPSV